MPQPRPYDRPFSLAERLLGYFTWDTVFSDFLGPSQEIHHGCHEDELQETLDAGLLQPRSVWDTEDHERGVVRRDGVWCTFNYYGSSPTGNRFGPLLLAFPRSALQGRRFAVIRRDDDRRSRYVFIQHEENEPLLPTEPAWPGMDPRIVWDEKGEGTIRDLILTQPLPLEGVRITPVMHRECVPGKCPGRGQQYGRDILNTIAMPQAQAILMGCPEYAAGTVRVEDVPDLLLRLPGYLFLVRRFPDLASERLLLPSPLEGHAVRLPDPPQEDRS